MSDIPVIEIRDLFFSYGEIVILENVNITVSQGEFIMMVGPNGGGKTTLLKLMLGMYRPNRGEIRILGGLPLEKSNRIGYVTQYFQFDPRFPMSVLDVVLMGTLGGGFIGFHSRSNRDAAMRALEEVEMASFARSPLANVSGGERQRVLIARALASDPEILLLDEPTSNIDTVKERDLNSLLEKLNQHMTIITVTHDLGFVHSLAQKVICVNRQVAIHPTGEITGEHICELYGSDIRWVKHAEHHNDHVS
ncbi:metal ABC transporter ATP-binding protein [bacterium]|nr:metal ABC transporter ATP-binding protein [bacterium]